MIAAIPISRSIVFWGGFAPAAMPGRASKLVYRLAHKALCDTTEFTVNEKPAALFAFDFFEPLPIQIQVSDAPLTSDAGLLPLG
jgi:hypothetical protein